MRKIFFSLLIFWAWLQTGFAQDQKLIDSLSVYLKGPDNAVKLTAISDLAWEYNRSDIKKAISLSKQGLKIAQELKLKPDIARAYEDLGTSYYYKRDFDSSAQFYRQAEKITKETKDTLGLASLYNKMGALYKERSEYQLSLQYSFESLKIYRKAKDIHKTALLLNNIGVTYETLKNYARAMDYYAEAIDYNTKENNNTGVARNYIGMGNVSTATGKFDDALVYYSKAETIFRNEEWLLELSVTLNNIGNTLDEQGKYSESVKKRTEALDIMLQGEDFFEATKYHCYIAGTLMKAGQFAEAKTHIEAAEKLSANIPSAELNMELYEAWSRYYFGTGHYVQGNQYLVQFHDLKDSLYSAELSENIAAMEVAQNTNQLRLAKAEAEAESLKSQQEKAEARTQRNYILFATAFIFVVGSLFLFLYLQKRRQNEEKKRIRAMLLSEEKERTRIARELHDGLGQLLSTVKLSTSSVVENIAGEDLEVLENSIRLVDEAIVEVRHISHNLMPVVLEQKGLLPALENLVSSINRAKKINVSFQYDKAPDKMDDFKEISIYRVMQEVVNNMIKHAEATQISIQASFQTNGCTIQVSDNGKGFNTQQVHESLGMGWNNIFTRVQLLKGQFQVNSAPGKGTSVTIKLDL